MTEQDANGDGSSASSQLAVNTPVVVFPGTAEQQGGVIVEDFGDSAGHAVDVGENQIASPARRWAVRLNSGDLVFLDSHQLSAL
jgi:hypothetical protein